MPRQIHALIVDDSTVSRQTLKRLLTETGLAEFSFTEAKDGADALEKFSPEAFDLLFVDMHMPRMNGVDFLSHIRTEFAACPPAVLVTAETGRDRLLAAVNEVGLAAVMLKPIKMERMREGLRKLVDTLPNRNGPWRVPHGECVAVALEETLRKLCHLDLQQSEHLETGQPSGAVFSMIYIFGGVDWFLQLRFDEVAAVVTASRLAGTKLAFDDPDLLDALAEVTSTVAGALKRLLIERGISVNVALPTVVGATGLRFHQPQGQMRSVDTLCYAGLGLDTASSAGSAHPGQICVAVTVGSPPGLML